MSLPLHLQHLQATTRRHFLRQTGLGFDALALQSLLARDGVAAEEEPDGVGDEDEDGDDGYDGPEDQSGGVQEVEAEEFHGRKNAGGHTSLTHSDSLSSLQLVSCQRRANENGFLRFSPVSCC